jgi:hypothetical protein
VHARALGSVVFESGRIEPERATIPSSRSGDVGRSCLAFWGSPSHQLPSVRVRRTTAFVLHHWLKPPSKAALWQTKRFGSAHSKLTRDYSVKRRVFANGTSKQSQNPCFCGYELLDLVIFESGSMLQHRRLLGLQIVLLSGIPPRVQGRYP